MNLMFCIGNTAFSFVYSMCSFMQARRHCRRGYAASDTDYDEILFEKKRTLTLLMDLPYPLSSYDQQSIEAYKNIIGEVSAALPSLNAIDEADDYILRLQEVLGSMRLTSGELPQVYIKVAGDIGDGYREASVMIVDTQGREHTRNTPVTIKLRGKVHAVPRKSRIRLNLKPAFQYSAWRKAKSGCFLQTHLTKQCCATKWRLILRRG